MDDQLLAALKALADASRLQIIGLLAKGPQSGDALAAALGLSASTVSHHLSKLAQAGLVEMRTEQYYNLYSLKPGALEGLGPRIIMSNNDGTLTTETDEAAYERKVLAEHVRKNGRADFPTGLQKQRAILRWLGATHFERSVRYKEFQVEDILERWLFFGPDTNSMRRYMISEKVLARTSNGSWYWRSDTPEAQRPGFAFEQLREAQHTLSSTGVARQLTARGKKRFTSDELAARMRELGVHDPAAMRARMLLLELLSPSADTAFWTVTDPWKVRVAREAEVKKRLLMDKRLPTLPVLPTDPADRLLALRWFADMLIDSAPYSDAELAKLWRFYFADADALKQALLEEGLLEPVAGGVAKYGLSLM